MTPDIAPIYMTNLLRNGLTFKVPLPRGWDEAIKKMSYKYLKTEVDKIVDDINKKAQRVENPFENIFLGYHERSEEEKKNLLSQIKIEKIGIDNRGAYGVQAGFDCNSGDIQLSSDRFNFAILGLGPIAHFFDQKVSWNCHNIDFYWQALLTRQFCVEYFNFLNRIICGKQKIIIQNKLFFE